MSKTQVTKWFRYLENNPDLAAQLSAASGPHDLIEVASDAGLQFSEDDFRSALNELIFRAESLPRPWGWPVARKLGLARK